ncbi:MAG: amidohydrolase family protein, partial [Planctomycetaceae bacterium]
VSFVAFRELITLAAERIPAQLEALQQHGRDCHAYSSIQPGVSPHAPYSVHPDLFSSAVRHAREQQMPLAIHLAETIAEIEFLKSGEGEFRDFLQELGVWQDDVFQGDRTPLDLLKEMADVAHGLIVHGNYLGKEEAEFLAAHRNLTVVYCPRTHAYFGHPPHPWKEFLTRGISLALGTDGRSSNPDLSLWNELHFLRRHHPDVSPETILSLGTLRGARALGLEQHFGSLTPGKRGAIAVVVLPEYADALTSDPYELLFSSTSRMEGLLYPPVEPRTQ